ncbi:hypothetical protein QWY81_07315 [Polaribacter undariae]|uniref:Lipoprotein n=1 Tax=Polaribacter sejongensis TaxID=985043 RepID=A0AAJ1QWA7_9FLAO|nr:hypothetical protein [Polaribacter undariae]MDN3619260.1 hypothetical protein [Polaribacter undariae]UWD33539.1 hypothetical protein NQP51_07655 [Polaribacter undariae]
MKLIKKITKILTLTIVITLFFSCEDDCTKVVNIPKANPNYNPNNPSGNDSPFIDDFQEVPCDYQEPLTEPVNGPSS